MSLKDTIKGAREEVAASGNPFERPSAKGDSESGGSTSRSSDQGFSRRSAARSKPSRKAAAGVRVVSSGKKPKADMSKEERKAQRRKDREVEDRRYNVTQMLLEQNEDYMKSRKMWWVFLIAAVVLMAIALLLYGRITSAKEDPQSAIGIAAVVSMVMAYIVVIVGMIFDFTKIRPMRKEAEKRAESMSDKRLKTLLVEKAKKEEAEKAERKAKRPSFFKR
ncbi:MAG: Yip1 family protein [Coriobacteriales bacterium]|nr:Yip1 family protein [Coriobacteriales bacterium]